VRRRLLPAQRTQPALELCEAGALGPKPPILCLHGAFGGAWMWTERFLPTLARLGRQAAALSLRGHGNSPGREELPRTTLADYSADVLRAMDEFAEPPVIVAHSLGALLAQRLLGRRPLRALVLLAPLPPDGMLFITPRLLMTAPQVWFELLKALSSDHAVEFTHVRDTVFSDRIPAADVDRYLSFMVTESRSVLFECHLPLLMAPACVLGVPTLVVEGSADRLIPHDAAVRTALYHGGDHRVVEGAGHLIHLEPTAGDVASDVLRWLDERGL
jgi:pimeloyl-ACP methyl ester carboxylesterase